MLYDKNKLGAWLWDAMSSLDRIYIVKLDEHWNQSQHLNSDGNIGDFIYERNKEWAKHC